MPEKGAESGIRRESHLQRGTLKDDLTFIGNLGWLDTELARQKAAPEQEVFWMTGT